MYQCLIGSDSLTYILSIPKSRDAKVVGTFDIQFFFDILLASEGKLTPRGVSYLPIL